jgi:hypothetical protein
MIASLDPAEKGFKEDKEEVGTKCVSLDCTMLDVDGWGLTKGIARKNRGGIGIYIAH